MTFDSTAPVLLLAVYLFAAFGLVDTWDGFTR
jgi:hypothetical protein